MAETIDPNDPGLREIGPDGQQQNYLILSEAERARGFVRPVRRSYVHVACGTSTRMGQSIAETYAARPSFYDGTFCCQCGKHFPLVDADGERAFLWEDGTGVGT